MASRRSGYMVNGSASFPPSEQHTREHDDHAGLLQLEADRDWPPGTGRGPGGGPQQQSLLSETLMNEFAAKKKPPRRKAASTVTLPRAFFPRPKPTEELPRAVPVAPSESLRCSDNESRASEPKLRRKSSFKALLDKFRQYKSTDNLTERRRRPVVHYVEETPGRLVVPVTGLQNHGNSCYMNAVFQCLNNTAQIYAFFISGQYRKELARRNRDNSRKYGTNGELTEACGGLVQSLGRATYTAENSTALMGTVARHWDQFHDGGEQDAQEFLTWLLDRIHEDLNRKARKKLKIRKTKPDDRLAGMTEEAWGRSFISRLYRGLFRSSLTCKQCGQQSNTFDPFMCLSVPLPQVDMRPFFTNLVFFDLQSRITRYGFTTSVDCCVMDIKDLVGQKTSIRIDEMVVLEVGDKGFLRTMCSDHGSDVLQDVDELYVVELPKARKSEEEEHIFIIVLHISTSDGQVLRRISSPRVVQVSREVTYKELEEAVLGNIEASGLFSQTKANPFRLRLVERADCLNAQLDHPLYTEAVDECLSFHQPSAGPRHLKLYVEWDEQHAEVVAQRLIREKLVEDASVAGVRNMPEAAKKTSLSDCLDLLMQEEKVGMDESDLSWECPSCGGRQMGTTKRGTLWNLPEILVIHLKRFRQTASTRFKLTTMVDFPLHHLDMTRYLTKDEDLNGDYRALKNAKPSWLPWHKARRPPDSQTLDIHSYSLFGVVNHMGRLNSGHYTAFCRHPADGAWYMYDDLKVKTMSNTRELVTRDAYLLFYQRDPLETHPSLYYNDFEQISTQNAYRLRPAVLRQSRSTEDISDTLNHEDQREALVNGHESSEGLTRTAQIYASLPRYTRRPLIVHKPVAANGLLDPVPQSPGSPDATVGSGLLAHSLSQPNGALSHGADRSPPPPPRAASATAAAHVPVAEHLYQRHWNGSRHISESCL